jgi:acetyl-CoA acyltransferase
MATAGVEPRIMGMGPLHASNKLLARLGLDIEQMGVIELNEAFASQALAVICGWGLADDDARVNPNGGAIALGHPLGMSGVRILQFAAQEMQRTKSQYGLATMCIGVGQGIATVLERV